VTADALNKTWKGSSNQRGSESLSDGSAGQAQTTGIDFTTGGLGPVGVLHLAGCACLPRIAICLADAAKPVSGVRELYAQQRQF